MTASKPVKARVAALRKRRAALGLVRIELWVRPEHHPLIKAFAKSLSGETRSATVRPHGEPL